jgi:hypothetical protein
MNIKMQRQHPLTITFEWIWSNYKMNHHQTSYQKSYDAELDVEESPLIFTTTLFFNSDIKSYRDVFCWVTFTCRWRTQEVRQYRKFTSKFYLMPANDNFPTTTLKWSRTDTTEVNDYSSDGDDNLTIFATTFYPRRYPKLFDSKHLKVHVEVTFLDVEKDSIVPDLHSLASKQLLNCVSFNNICEVMQIAVKFDQLFDLRKKCVQMFYFDMAEVKTSQEWLKMNQNEQQRFIKLFKHYYVNKSN